MLLERPVSIQSQSDNESEEDDLTELDVETEPQQEWTAVVGDFQNFNFQENAGITQDVINLKNENELTYYKLFVSEDIINTIVDQTNIYANQVIVNGICEESIGPSSRLNKWTPTDKHEIYRFLGIIIWMGLDKKPKLSDYWRNSDLYWSKAAKVMSRNRFEILLRMLHFADNELCPESDRLHKIQSLLDALNAQFKKFLIPEENMCIDETMVPFRGKLKFRQYIKEKRHKFGIKLFKLCLPGGYTFHSKIYCGADKIDGMSVATKVVLELLGGSLDKGVTLYTDNWYTSIELAKKLKNRRTHLVGTLRRNRKGLPKVVTSAKLRKGEIVGREKDGVVIFKWKDKRDVLMLTTKHNLDMIEVPGRAGARMKPKAVAEYNRAKSFIDLSDQMSSYSTSLRRSLKWYRKVAVEMIIGASIVNAQYLYNKNQDKHNRKSITNFKENLCLQLMSNNLEAEPQPELQPEQHVYTTADRRGRCSICYRKNKDAHGRTYAIKKTKQVSSICTACVGKPLLCIDCFFENHSVTAKK